MTQPADVPGPTAPADQPDPASAPPADPNSTNPPNAPRGRGRRRGQTDETGATPPANIRTQRYTDGQRGFEAGNLAATTMYEKMNEDGTYSGRLSKTEPERGRVLVVEGDIVHPHVAAAVAAHKGK